MDHPNLESHIHGGLAGAVIGDALGSLTETLSRRQIGELYGWVDDFQPFRFKPFGQVRPVGGWTDDSSLIYYTLRAFIAENDVTLDAVIAGLDAWSRDPDVSQFSGPTTARALERIAAGEDPRKVGLGEPGPFAGISNGSAMKAAPAGWVNPGDIPGAVETVALISAPTHNTNLALAGAGAIAAACAVAATGEATVEGIVAGAIEGARRGNAIGLQSGREVAGPAIDRRIQLAVDITQQANDFKTAVSDISDLIGSGLAIADAVPAALAVVSAADRDLSRSVIACANLGDDTDTVGTMAGAITGTLVGRNGVKDEWYTLVSEVNNLDLAQLAADVAELVAKRSRGGARP